MGQNLSDAGFQLAGEGWGRARGWGRVCRAGTGRFFSLREERGRKIFGEAFHHERLKSATYRVNLHLCVVRSELYNILYFSLVGTCTLQHNYYTVHVINKGPVETH